MITSFKIYESEHKISELYYSKTYESTLWKYRDIVFGKWGHGYRLVSDSEVYRESWKMSHYLDDVRGGIEHPDEYGYSSPEYLLGKTFDEVKETIDEYYFHKETKKFNL